jgi:hypothetical protein
LNTKKLAVNIKQFFLAKQFFVCTLREEMSLRTLTKDSEMIHFVPWKSLAGIIKQSVVVSAVIVNKS